MSTRNADASRVVARLILEVTEDPENSNGSGPPTPAEIDVVVRRLVEIGRDLDTQLSEIVYGGVSTEPSITPFRNVDFDLFHDARVMLNGFVVERVDQTALWKWEA